MCCFQSGAPVPADWNPLPGLESHVPVLFLDLNPDDLSMPNQSNLNGSFESGSYLDGLNLTGDGQYLPMAGIHSILPKEHGGQFYHLPIIKYPESEDVGAIASWDSSVHDSPSLNRITEGSERIYLILKATVRFRHLNLVDI